MTAAVALTPDAITLEAMTSGAGIGISPKKGILNVATPSSVDKISLVFGGIVGIVSGFSCNSSSFEDDVSSVSYTHLRAHETG